MKALYLKYPWTAKQLHNKRVEFHVEYPDKVFTGTGHLTASTKMEGGVDTGLMSVEIISNPRFDSGCEVHQTAIRPTEDVRFLIEPHPNQDVADFRLSSYTEQP